MLSKRIVESVPKIIKRNYGITAPALKTATDPIQQLFIDKIREYKQKGESSPEYQKQKKAELAKAAASFGGAEGVDMTSFPKFTFPEPEVDVGIEAPKK